MTDQLAPREPVGDMISDRHEERREREEQEHDARSGKTCAAIRPHAEAAPMSL